MITLAVLVVSFLATFGFGLLFLAVICLTGHEDSVSGEQLLIGIGLTIILFYVSYELAESVDKRVCQLGYYECVDEKS